MQKQKSIHYHWIINALQRNEINYDAMYNHKQMKQIIEDIDTVAENYNLEKLKLLVKMLTEVLEQLKLGLLIQNSSSKIMQSLVGDILDFAQISNGKFKRTEEYFDIKKTIFDLIMIQEYKAKKKGVRIETVF